jgi:hypothetical protein
MLQLGKVIDLGLQKVGYWWPPAGLGKGMIDWLGKVRLG